MGRTPQKHPIRIVTAAALFDGHDAAINIMRRLLQASGAEVIHLGHNRGAAEVVAAAIQEDAQGIAVSSYQGGHVEYFRYLRQLLDDQGATHVRIFGGGGGVIVPREIKALQAAGIDRIFSPEDGRKLGLQGMIDQILEACDFSTLAKANGRITPRGIAELTPSATGLIAHLITAAETDPAQVPAEIKASLRDHVFPRADQRAPKAPVVGLTGPGGAGKSSLTDELVRRFKRDFPDRAVAILAVDPTKRKSGGALLGDRIRLNVLEVPGVYMRSLATRASTTELSDSIRDAVRVCQASGFDLILVETAGIGQGDADITQIADVSVYAMTAEYGAQSQLEKIEMLDHADLVAINKFERRGSLDALRDVRKQIRRARGLFDPQQVPDDALPVVGTIAGQFNDPGVSRLYVRLLDRIRERCGLRLETQLTKDELDGGGRPGVVPPKRERYLAEIAETIRDRRREIAARAELASRAYATFRVLETFPGAPPRPLQAYAPAAIEAARSSAEPAVAPLMARYNAYLLELGAEAIGALEQLRALQVDYAKDELSYEVRGQTISVPLVTETLSHTKLRKVALPRYRDWGDLYTWAALENVPGGFPFTAGIYPMKRTQESPARMFAGEGPPERTNRRFHLLSHGQPAVRLSTAFDSVTLYGEDPHERPDIFGKVGESGVSVATVEDAEALYAGFDLCAPNTSVSMTINGPAPIVLAFFFNVAIRQQCRRFLLDRGRLSIEEPQIFQPDSARGSSWEDVRALLSSEELAQIRAETLCRVRGTVQADILKEDQAQNTCIFATEFALKMMGDMQAFFIEENVKNYYSVSISGYHIAEAGANPITQLAFTLANGLTYVEYYLARGMSIDDFAPNLSFFFSNGLDPEYTVIGRVARRIWSVAMARRYGGNDRSQKLKYHIQTSGRSLHAMEIDFNDIRTTLQALLAIQDNTNSLHTNAFDEALTTPTDQSVRRALAIQMIIEKELGLSKNENPLQGSFIVEELTDLVEEAVLEEFDRLTERGGVLGAMETQYQRSRIQEESLHYEQLKHRGTLPIIGVNTFQNPHSDYEREADQVELRRASPEEKETCIRRLRAFQARHRSDAAPALARLEEVALSGGNVFAELMQAVNVASLGQITRALYAVGGQYRRNA
ncbi:MAG: cobalamin-dependent protein [Deltaproteobacteria bacterium]|nr:cobalamin-dependent protein [Deltaproteobacteria bacterium]